MEKVVSRLSGAMGFARQQAGRPPRSLRAALAARVQDAERVQAARGRLVQAGVVEGLVRRFPPVQVILLDEKRDYELRRDEVMKLLALPPWQIDALPDGEVAGQGGEQLFVDLLPDVVGARRIQGQVEQRVALLRCVEVLRQYAAEHGGQLPARLSEVSLPLPADPFTGQLFPYEVEAATARLRGRLPRGGEKSPDRDVCYEVVLQK
jgi:hypothetical protein